VDEEPSLYERVWGESPPAGALAGESAGASARSRVSRRKRLEPPTDSSTLDYKSRADEHRAGTATALDAELASWAEDLVRRAVAEVEASVAKKLNFIESRILTVTKYTREQLEKTQRPIRSAIPPPDLRPIESSLERLSERLKVLEGTLHRAERRTIADDKAYLQTMVELVDHRFPAVRTAELSEKLDLLQRAITHLAGPPPEDQEALLRRMVDVIDERLASGPVEDLSTRMVELEETLAEGWRKSLAQYNEDKLGLVEMLESKLQTLLGQLEEHATHSGSMQHRIENDLVGGFAKLAAQLTNQLGGVQVEIEHGLGEQQRALAALLKSMDSIASSLEKIVGRLRPREAEPMRGYPWDDDPT
jgi:hypothetical protein